MRSLKSIVLAGALFGLLMLRAGAAEGGDVPFGNLQLVGDAQLIGDRIRLTGATYDLNGAVWDVDQVDVQSSFVTQFSFAITEEGGLPNQVDGTTGADGIAFVIQNHSAMAIGVGGADLGFGGVPNSIAIEFDTWMNHGASPPEYNDPDGSHISVHTCGMGPNSADEACSLGSISYPALVEIDEHVAKIAYESGLLQVYLDDLSHPILSVDIELSEVLSLNEGRAWVGFTSSTGAAYENHDIFDWSIEESPVPTRAVTWGQVKAAF